MTLSEEIANKLESLRLAREGYLNIVVNCASTHVEIIEASLRVYNIDQEISASIIEIEALMKEQIK